jgi:hypothetical protein
MLTGLQQEIDNCPELTGASKEIIINTLNADGSAQTEMWIVIPIAEQKIKLSKLAVLTYLSPAQRAGIRAMLADTSDAAQDFKMLYEADNEFWINDLTFRSMLDTLGAVLSIDASVITEIKRLGERKISRAEELFGRKITTEDFE